MKEEHYRSEVIQRMSAYLNGRLSWKEVSDWATKVLVSRDFSALGDDDVREGIMMLSDLDDMQDAPQFCPSRTQLEHHRDLLAQKGEPSQ